MRVESHSVARGHGEPLVLIPGWSQTTRAFARQPVALSDCCRVIAVDMRGHGESSKALHGYRIARLAQGLQKFLRALALEEVTLGGHSMGASVLWSYLEQLAAERPARLPFIDQAPLVTNGAGLIGSELLETGAAFTPETLCATALAGLRATFFGAAVGEEDFVPTLSEREKIPGAGAC